MRFVLPIVLLGSTLVVALSGCTLQEGRSGDRTILDPDMAVNADGASYFLMDRATGTALEGRDSNRLRAPASTTKLMTALVVMEAIEDGELDLDDMVAITEDPVPDLDGDGFSDYGGSSVGLVQGDVLSVDQLLHGMLMASGNDAAHVLARDALGSVDWTVERMNDKARRLGMDRSSFVNVHGRDPNDMRDTRDCPLGQNAFHLPECAHYMSSRDLATLLDAALDDPTLEQILGTQQAVFGDVIYTSTNALLPGGTLAFPNHRVYAGKTGSSDRGQFCVALAASVPGRDRIAVYMGVPLGMGGVRRWEESTLLVEHALALEP